MTERFRSDVVKLIDVLSRNSLGHFEQQYQGPFTFSRERSKTVRIFGIVSSMLAVNISTWHLRRPRPALWTSNMQEVNLTPAMS